MQFLYRIARSWFGSIVIGWVFSYLSFALPVDRLRETKTIIAFHHPSPSHPIHILLVPKRRCRSLMDLSIDDAELLRDLFCVMQDLIAEFGLEEGGYRLIVNGGEAQDVDHLHFHLISAVSSDK
jgi:histidine triad (HIT) family protein